MKRVKKDGDPSTHISVPFKEPLTKIPQQIKVGSTPATGRLIPVESIWRYAFVGFKSIERRLSGNELSVFQFIFQSFSSQTSDCVGLHHHDIRDGVMSSFGEIKGTFLTAQEIEEAVRQLLAKNVIEVVPMSKWYNNYFFENPWSSHLHEQYAIVAH